MVKLFWKPEIECNAIKPHGELCPFISTRFDMRIKQFLDTARTSLPDPLLSILVNQHSCAGVFLAGEAPPPSERGVGPKVK